MAKVRADYSRYKRNRGGRKLRVTVEVYPTGSGKGQSFQACADFGGAGRRGPLPYASNKGRDQRSGCAWGKNPRQAIGRALKAAGAIVEKRGGAFAGLKGRK